MEHIRSDMLRYMTVEAANAILIDYKDHQQRAQSTPVWKPSWFEKQIIATQNKEEQEQEPQGKRKKTAVNNNDLIQKQEQTQIRMFHKQNANKALSEAAMTNEERRLAILEQTVAELQTNNMEAKITMSEIKDSQHRDQEKIIGLQTQMEQTNRKTDVAISGIKDCKAAIGNIESKLSSLSTLEDTNQRFDRIESMLLSLGVKTTNTTILKTITGKRKEEALLLEEGEEESFADSQENMDTENDTNKYALCNGNDGTGHQTNTQAESTGMKVRLRLK
jgi:hypothetical protein